MTIIKNKLRSALAALCLVACNGSLGTKMTDTDDTNGDTTSNTSSDDDFGFCSAAKPCPDGQFCFNGICALGCTNDGDCADNQYCATDGDMLCHNKEVPTCPETPCGETQVCVNGFCSTPPPSTQCEPNPVDDGCASNAVCVFTESEETKCYTFPYCSADDTCPVGTEGAVCNVDLIPSKDKICLVGLCTDSSHCPAEWNCVEFEANSVLGICSNGGFGASCTENSHCVSGSCSLPFPGEPGFCN